jgi:cytochrome c-type biogenesis protein
MTDITPLFIASVFLAGLLSFFAPCILPLLPVYVATLSSGLDNERKDNGKAKAPGFRLHGRLIGQTAVFVGGLATTFVLLGFGAGALGGLLSSRIFLLVAGGIVVLLGLHQTGLLHLVFLEREKRLQLPDRKGDKGSADPQGPRTGILGSYLLGLTFSFGWTPCIGPVLATVLVLASSGNQVLYGGAMMMIYTLGLAVPFLLIAVFTDVLLRTFRKLNKYLPVLRIVGGVLIIAMGILLMTDNLNVFSRLFPPQ